MSQICLEQIISVKNHCNADNPQSISGYDLMDAPEIDLSMIESLLKSDYNSGYKVLKNCVRLAIREIETDFITTLHANQLVTNNQSVNISSGNFTTRYTNSANAEQGVTIYKSLKSSIKKLKISKILVYPTKDYDSAEIIFIDSNKRSSINVQLIGGKINEFNVEYYAEGDYVRVLMNGVETYSSELTCLLGCNGTKPNECGYVKGYNGVEVNKEGFGINVIFSCECDYSQILCNQSKTFVGHLLFLKARIMVLEERINSTRINPFIIYGQEEAKALRLQLIEEYNSKWNVFIDNIPNLAEGECFNCKKSRIVTNV